MSARDFEVLPAVEHVHEEVSAEDERLARVVLSRAGEPGDLRTASILSQLGARATVRELSNPQTNGGLAARVQAVDPAQELERAAKQGMRFVIPGDSEWPTRLDHLEGVENLGLGGVPVGLWVRGPMRLSDLADSVAVVGSRASSIYGEEVAGDLAATVARAGLPVISGGALGIDMAAHRGALGAHGPTVAVLAGGADRPYPVRHADFLAHLARHHAVVSEAPRGSDPTKIRFLARNRIIAALTLGTVVVEAAIRSGALNTATWADLLSRPVMGVPGPVFSASSQGVHHRIRIGGASLVTNGHDVLEMVGVAGDHLIEEPREEPRPHDRLTRKEQLVLETVPTSSSAPLDVIAHMAGMTVRDVDSVLSRLQSAGFVTYDGSGWCLVPGR